MKSIIALSISCLVALNATAQNFDRSIRPKAGPAPTINLGESQSFTLPNGLKVFVVENHKLPTVSYQLDIDIAPALQGGAVGFQDMIGELLGSGTKKKSKDEFNMQLDALGGTLAAGSDGVYASCLTKHQDKLLALMSEMLLQPNFSQKELDKLKTQALSGLESEKDNPEYMSGNMVKSLVYGSKHPYGEIQTTTTTKAITLPMCTKYYNTYFKPNAAYMAVVGDITLDEAKKLVTKYFGAWKKGIVPTSKYSVPTNNTGTRVTLVNKPGAVQSVIDITYPINLKHGTPDVVKARVANEILGGGMTGRLFQNLRETHAWTYGSYSSISPDKYDNSATFSATSESKTESTDSSVSEIFKEMNRMRSEPVEDKILEGVKKQMAGKFALGLEDPKTIARYAINIQKFKMPSDYYKNYLKSLDAITASDIVDISKKYINPDLAYVTIAGDKAEVASKVAKFAKSGKVEMLNIYGQPEKEAAPSKAPNMKAEDIIAAYINAVGGTENWKNIKDITTTSELNAGPGQTLELVEKKKAPNKYFQELKGGGMVFQKQVFDGVKGKSGGMQGEKEFDKEDIEKMKEESYYLGELAYGTAGYKLSSNGIEQVDGKDAYVVKVSKPNGESELFYYDAVSKLKVKSSRSVDGPGGQKATMVMTYSNYQIVSNGMKMPYKIVQKVGPQSFEITVKSIEINKGIEDAVFEVK